MPSFISTGKKLKVLTSSIWSNNQQALFGIAPSNTNLESGPQTSVQCFAVVEDINLKPETMTIYLLVNTQFKSINENGVDDEQVKMKDCEIKIARSFDLTQIHSGELNYNQLHALGKDFATEVLKYAQFALFSELGKADALPLGIYENLIFNPENISINLDASENKVNLTPFIHYYRLLNIPRMHLIDQFIKFAKKKGEMSFTVDQMRFCLSEQPCLGVLNNCKHSAAKPVDLRHPHLLDIHIKGETALQEMFKSVLYDLTMNGNNRKSHEYELFSDLLHTNNFNEAFLSHVQPTNESISNTLDQMNYALFNFSNAQKNLDKIEDNIHKQHYQYNLAWFAATLGYIEAAVESCCHVYTVKK
ncbi:MULTISPECIES: hypothetical protein [Acinetobacter]|uniref:Uncharacterized protein n=1 Tax=Acinetobacter indicus TaxID=756892 RepID=A0A6C0Y7N3_9GAMM|nr:MULTISPECIES: hypothetical protein [Acinetobacter]QIC72110.1 hypothetical protein FSC09_17275 [Acinetobacter indicus]QKQ71488.1 hypothetical protein E5Y90_14750 [Acinetobacter sp. 10FS3-1]